MFVLDAVSYVRCRGCAGTTVEVGARLPNLVEVHRQMGVELAGEPLEQPAGRGVKLRRGAARVDHHEAEVRGWIVGNLPEAAAGAGHQERFPAKSGAASGSSIVSSMGK